MTILIGTRDEADYVSRCYYEGSWSSDQEITKLGQGAYRVALLFNNVVYKVDKYKGMTSAPLYSTAHEVRTAQRLLRRFPGGMVGEHVRIPKVSGFNINGTIVAGMEHIIGECASEEKTPISKKARQELFSLGFADMHGANYMVEYSTGRLVPVDMASPRNRGGDMRALGGTQNYPTALRKKVMRQRKNVCAEEPQYTCWCNQHPDRRDTAWNEKRAAERAAARNQRWNDCPCGCDA